MVGVQGTRIPKHSKHPNVRQSVTYPKALPAQVHGQAWWEVIQVRFCNELRVYENPYWDGVEHTLALSYLVLAPLNMRVVDAMVLEQYGLIVADVKGLTHDRPNS